MICGMQIDLATGLIARTRQVMSPYFDARPRDKLPDLIVIHGISLPPGEFGGAWIDQLFTGTLDPDAHPFFRDASRLRVSSHALIRRDGSIVQYVPFQARAWHAGESQYQGRAGCNDFSIGIELEGTDDLAYEDAQYESLVSLIRALLAAYPSLSSARIVGHSDIAPGRKTDPGAAFDWQRLRRSLL
jgi:AmpD protein